MVESARHSGVHLQCQSVERVRQGDCKLLLQLSETSVSNKEKRSGAGDITHSKAPLGLVPRPPQKK